MESNFSEDEQQIMNEIREIHIIVNDSSKKLDSAGRWYNALIIVLFIVILQALYLCWQLKTYESTLEQRFKR